MTPQTTTGITELRTVAVPVTDQDTALAFYVDVLGFEKRLDAPLDERERWIEVAPAGAATAISLVLAHEGRPAGTDTGIRLTTEDADADHEHLRAHHVDVDAHVLRWEAVPPMFTFRDLDGNTLVIVERP